MRNVTLIISNEYEMISGEVNGITVNSYYANQDTDTAAHTLQGQLSLEAALQAIRVFTETFGEYPYGELDVVESNYEFGGMEAPGLVRISQMYSWSIGAEDETERAEYADKLCGTVAHEVAHEWFYGVVGNDQYNEAWLDESFAVYGEQLYWRSMGRSETEIAQQMDEFAAAVPSGGDETVNRPYDELLGADFDYTNAVYQRGAAFLYGLEQALGLETFQQFLQQYYKEHSFQEVHTTDFLAALSPYAAENQIAQELVERYLG